ncbi:hypothetical protein ScPMuIL_016644 [Solemya velum]
MILSGGTQLKSLEAKPEEKTEATLAPTVIAPEEDIQLRRLLDTRHIPGRTIDTIQEERLLPCIESGQEVTPHQTISLIRECVEGGNDVYFQCGQTNIITRDIIMTKEQLE